MTITLSSTDRIIEVNGVPARLWQGRTERGIKIEALITRVSVPRAEDQDDFQRDLAEVSPPLFAITAFPTDAIFQIPVADTPMTAAEKARAARNFADKLFGIL